MQFEEIKLLLGQEIPGSVLDEDLTSSPHSILVDHSFLIEVCEFLQSHEKTYFDSLSCLTGIDNGVEAGTVDVVYNLYSIPHDLHLALKVSLNRKEPTVNSVSSVWKTADWHEREAYDLIGIKFKGHPDLRRILLPDDWEGHPLRKDYVEQEKYHDVVVKWKGENG